MNESIPMKPVEIHVLNHRVRLLQPPEGFRTSLDSVFLAAACCATEGQRVLDMGCGVGGASFCLLERLPSCRITGVDIQESHVELARRNISLNGREGQASFFQGDIRGYEAEPFDHIICNPPFLEGGSYTPSSLSERAIALGHKDKEMSLNDWVVSGFRLLRSGGTVTFIHRADFLDRILQAFGKRFGAVEIIPLWPKAGAPAKRVIVRAIKDRKTPCSLLTGIVLHEEGGAYTKAADAVLRDGAPIN